MNQLKVKEQQAIIALYEKGWSKRKIARELGLDRVTVRQHRRRPRRNGSWEEELALYWRSYGWPTQCDHLHSDRVLQCCRRRGIDPFAYLREVFARLPSMTNWQVKDITPEAWAKNKRRPDRRIAA